MNRKSLFASLALALLLPIGVQASDLSYNWVELDYIDAGSDIDGFGVRGSIQLGQSGLYGLGGYTDLDFGAPVGFTDLGNRDAQIWELGLGYAHGLSDSTDLIGELAYQDIESIDAYRASVGVRSGFTTNLEGIVKANYVDADCAGCDSDVTGTAGLQYKFTPRFGVVGEVEFGGGDQAYLVGLRASF